MTLEQITACLQGVIPSSIATCGQDGMPNATILSHVHYVDSNHVALSRQFFNKTTKNLAENPRVAVLVYDPSTMQGYQLALRFERQETEGPTFAAMTTRLAAIASHMRMTGVFRLRSADVFEVLAIEKVDGEVDLGPAPPSEAVVPTGAMSLAELRALHALTSTVGRAATLEELIEGLLPELSRAGADLSHTSLLLVDETGARLFTLASHGYAESGVGSEIAFGEGIVGTAAKSLETLCISNLSRELRYVRAQSAADVKVNVNDIALPDLPGVESVLVVPLIAGDELIGALVAQSTDIGAFSDRHQTILGIVANQAAARIRDLRLRKEVEDPPSSLRAVRRSEASSRRQLCFYRRDESIFVDGAYLIRNIPAKILWKVLSQHAREGRVDFTNRELRMDSSLQLPPIKDNLESRLILLRRRLADKWPDARLVSTGRGRFRLELDNGIELVEKEEP